MTSRILGKKSRLAHQASMSVILVVRNGSDFIAEALASVFRSKIKPMEILVIDGGSTDNTKAIAERFDSVLFLRQQSRGIANAYNEGIARARGELLAFISHDDYWLPGKLDRQVAFMESHPQLLLSVTHVQHFLEPGVTPPVGFRQELLDKPVPGLIMETLMARPGVFSRVGGFDPSFEVGEDTDWYARLIDSGLSIGVLPETLTMKRVHSSNASLNTNRTNALLLRVLRQSVQRKRRAELE